MRATAFRLALPAVALAAACGGGGGSSSSSADAGGDGALVESGSSGGGSSGSGSGGSSGSSGGSGSGSSSGAGSSSGGSGSSSGSGGDGGPTDVAPTCGKVDAGAHGAYGLPPTTGLPANVSSMTDWTQHPQAGGWQASQIMDACRYEVDPGGFTTWHGKPAVRVEVDPGDDPLDLGENTERAEDLTLQDATGKAIPENTGSGTQYFAFSYYFPTTWGGTQIAGNGNSWSIVLQLHGPDSLGASPAFALSAAKTSASGPEQYGVDTNGGALTKGCCGPSFALKDAGIALGKWTDFVLLVTFASTPTGHLTLWRRDEGQSGFTQEIDAANVATLQYASGQAVGDHYWKQGLYRGGVNRTDVLWLGPTVRASTFDAAEGAAFGTHAGP